MENAPKTAADRAADLLEDMHKRLNALEETKESEKVDQLRKYFAAAAPPVPKEVAEGYWKSLCINEPDLVKLPWNDHVLSRLAVQEARWREAFAAEMMKRFDKTAWA